VTELEKVLLRKLDRFQKEMDIMKDIIINGLPDTEQKQDKPKVEKYNPADDLQYFNDDDFQLVWKEYMSIRIRKKASNTDRAIKGAITNLNKLSNGSKRKAIAIVDQSVNSGWTGLFEPKDYVIKVSEKKPTNTNRWNREEQMRLHPEEYTHFDPKNIMGEIKIKRV
jgi:hypothetical protein